MNGDELLVGDELVRGPSCQTCAAAWPAICLDCWWRDRPASERVDLELRAIARLALTRGAL